MRRAYLDHSATSPLDPRVLEEMLPHLRGGGGNPSSLHEEGRRARRAVEDAREEVAALIGAEPREVLFTSGATESNNLALQGLRHEDGSTPATLVVSAVEHPSVLEPASRLEREGRWLHTLPVDQTGAVDPAAVAAAVDPGRTLVAVMAANNEVGTLQPWEAVAAACRDGGALHHCDAVQVLGKVPFDVRALGPGCAAFSAHKLAGPKGVGALWVAPETRLVPLARGGGQERDRRAGTENVAGIVGFGAACRFAREALDERRRARLRLEELLLAELRRRTSLDLEVHGPPPPGRLPGLLNVRFPGVPGETLLFALDLEGVSVSLGSACSSGAVQPSHVLAAMGVGKRENLESVRISLSWDHGEEEIAAAAGRIARTVTSISKRERGLRA